MHNTNTSLCSLIHLLPSLVLLLLHHLTLDLCRVLLFLSFLPSILLLSSLLQFSSILNAIIWMYFSPNPSLFVLALETLSIGKNVRLQCCLRIRCLRTNSVLGQHNSSGDSLFGDSFKKAQTKCATITG